MLSRAAAAFPLVEPIMPPKAKAGPPLGAARERRGSVNKMDGKFEEMQRQGGEHKKAERSAAKDAEVAFLDKVIVGDGFTKETVQKILVLMKQASEAMFGGAADLEIGKKSVQALMRCFDTCRLEDAVVMSLNAPSVYTSETFETLLKLEVIEAMQVMAKSLKKAKSDVQAALENHVAIRAAAYLDTVDYHDYQKLDAVMKLVNLIGLMQPHEGLLLASLPAMERLARNNSENKKRLIKLGGVKACGFILKTFPDKPPLLLRAVTVLYDLTVGVDVGGGAADHPGTPSAGKGKGKGKDQASRQPHPAVSVVINDSELVVNMVRTLDRNPLNTKLIFAGMRLLAEWLLLDDRLQRKVFEAGAGYVALHTRENLIKGDLTPMASWLDCIAWDVMHPPDELKDVRPDFVDGSPKPSSPAGSRRTPGSPAGKQGAGPLGDKAKSNRPSVRPSVMGGGR